MARRVNLNSLLNMMKVVNLDRQTEDEMRVASAFMALWPQEGETLNAYRRSPGCASCRGSLIELFAADPGRVKAFLKRLSPDQEITVDITSDMPHGTPRARDPMGPKSIAGQTRDIEDTEKAYAELIKDLRVKGMRYTGLTIRAVEMGRVRVYFY